VELIDARGAQIEEWVRRAFAGRYPVVRLLGRGAMGAVVLARDNVLQRNVAIKVLLPELAEDPANRERFRQEVLTNARLEHPNIVPVYATGETEGLPYLVMRFVHGESLATRLSNNEPIPVPEVCRILADLSSALHYAHRQQVVHRDIKPENVLIDRNTGVAMLTDFGIARGGSLDAMSIRDAQRERGIVRGTLAYMSPEQAAGSWELDGRSDLYALGVLGYAMLCGRLPVIGNSFQEISAQHAAGSPPPIPELAPDVPRRVVEIVMQCLEKDPTARWSDGMVLRDALIDAGLDRPGPSLGKRLGLFLKRSFKRRRRDDD
jgi:serine/threonine-protein kinase